MPVPVPRVIKTIAHPVVKYNRGIDQTPQFPGSTACPSSLNSSREEWISSLPSWRRSKPRRIWEEDSRLPEQGGNPDFFQGLAVADNASAIKGSRAQACLPPLGEIQRQSQVEYVGDKSSMLSHPYSAVGDNWEGDGDDAMMDVDDNVAAAGMSPNLVFTDLATYESQTYAHSPYTPNDSPGSDSGPDDDSSPLEPITPFADFIDRAVAAEQPFCNERSIVTDSSIEFGKQKEEKALVFPTLAEPAKEAAPAPLPDVVTPSATTGYKKLAEPISEWLASYVWKVCTTGLDLPMLFRYPSGRVAQYSSAPPAYLAPSIHSLLLSTLLQPSAIFLSLWYIVRLPVFFNAAELGQEHAKEMNFRQALLGDPSSYERDGMELNAPFRVFVLGCMLANKWLDDHTFSNKTWHTISNVPIQVLNKLEVLALDAFTYDLTISSRAWTLWMGHLKAYHMSLASPHLQPISRPSSNPHSIIRASIDEILQAPTTSDPTSPIPQPVFLGIEERKQEKIEAQAAALEVRNIDMDEDGPLRAEYLPRRRENAGAIRMSRSCDAENIPCGKPIFGKSLPPPAKWSPAADEPILRDRNRSSGHYVAVQPNQPCLYAMPYRAPEVVYSHSWDSSYGGAFKAYPTYAYAQPSAPMNAAQYYPAQSMATMTHARSQSLFYDSEYSASRNHLRSYSHQARFDYKHGDSRISTYDHLSAYETETRWAEPNPYIYGGPYAAPMAVPTW